MNKAILLMYNSDVSEIIRFKNMLNDIEIVQIVAPKGWGFAGEDAGVVDGGMITGSTINYEINFDIQFDMAIIFSELDERIIRDMYSIYFAKLMQRNIRILCSNKIKKVLNSLNGAYDNFMMFENLPIKRSDRVFEIDTPIILVAGTHENTQKFQIQLYLKKVMERKGYKISMIGSKEFSELFGGHSFPRYMFETDLEKNKITAFCSLIKMIENDEKPDAIIIGVPGGMLPYNDKFCGYFGITLYEVMLAVRPDILVLSCLFEQYDADYFEELSLLLKYRFGVMPDCFNISDFQVDTNESEQTNILQYLKIANESVKSMAQKIESKYPIFCVGYPGDGDKMGDYVTKILEEYACAEFV